MSAMAGTTMSDGEANALAHSRWRAPSREARDTLFMVALIGWTLLPHLFNLPLWVTGLTGVVLAWRGWLAPGRGLHPLPLLRAESRYPFGLFRAWTIWRPAGQQWVYPRPESPTPPWPQTEAAQGDDRHAARTGSGTEFEGVRAYRRGDTLRQVVWKKAARTGEMISRETAGAVQREMHFQWSQAQGLDTEARLSRIAAWVVAADAAGHAWSLQLPGTELAPDNGSAHRHAALQALARW